LRRALVDMGVGPTHALLKAVGMAIDHLLRLKTPAPEQWPENPFLFDQVVISGNRPQLKKRPAGGGPTSRGALLVTNGA
jgi:hypothetical protein